MSSSRNKKPRETIVALAPRQLPFETWRPIFQVVFATQTSISHPPSDFAWSSLNSRLNIYRNLALVSRSWRANARDVFFEELEAHTAEAVKGIIKTFQSEPLALAVSKISFSFWEFRCSASLPRRPRPLRPVADTEAEASAGVEEDRSRSRAVRTPDWKTIHRRDFRHYVPSSTAQGSHWTRWQADVAQILTMCTSLSEVEITFTGDRRHSSSSMHSRDYRAFFAPPDLTNERILHGLLASTNLRKLHLVDPTPLEQYGPALTSWTRLADLSITLTRSFEELQDTAFIPPKSLASFRFNNTSSGRIPWPLSSDLAKCTNLQVLDLGAKSLTNVQTAKAIGFLCSAYQHSLRDLTLDLVRDDGGMGFQPILEAARGLHFPKLERLRLLQASYDTSVFSYFTADVLKTVEVGWLALEPGTGSREDKWSRGLAHASLRALKVLMISRNDPDDLRKQALSNVCERLGISLITGRPSREYEDVDDEYEVVEF